jgi:hypothetical protein
MNHTTLYASCRRPLCQFLECRTHTASYAFFMDKSKRILELETLLYQGDYGRSAREVLETCALVAEYAQEHTPDQIKAFQEKVKINPQVWLRLIALHRDQRLKKHLEHLPISYTTLYAIHRMRDEEIDAAVQQGVIHPKASSHGILSWSKQYRQQSVEGIPPWRCLMVFDRRIDKSEYLQMRRRIDEITAEYGARLVSEWDYIQPETAQDDFNQQKIAEVERKILELSAPFYERMTAQERREVGVEEPKDLVQLDMMNFGWITRPDLDINAKAMRHQYTPAYVYKLALEFLKTDSRSQRFNYKRRLKQLAEKQSDLEELIEEVLATYMKR